MKRITLLFAVASLCTISTLRAQVGKLLFSEGFNGTALNTNIWNYGSEEGGNGELESYTTKPTNVKVENGNLVITAIRENDRSKSFTSGKVSTQNKLTMKYGMMEVKAKMPKVSNGLWPAMRMEGNLTKTGPSAGEVVIMEAGIKETLGLPTPDNTLRTNIVWDPLDNGAYNYADQANRNDLIFTNTASLQSDYLLYQYYWTPTNCHTEIRKLDGTLLFTGALMTFYDKSEEFNNPFYVMFNMAVGGNPTNITTTGAVTALPNAGSTQSMFIDYVNVYQYNGYGEVKSVADIAEKGVFGVFVDGFTPNKSMDFGAGDRIDIWENTLSPITPAPTPAPSSGTATMGFQSPAATWVGMAYVANQPKNMNNFKNGSLNFKFKLLSVDPLDRARDLTFGINSNAGEAKVVIPSTATNNYGLTGRALDVWYNVSIPFTDPAFKSFDFSSIYTLLFVVANGRDGGGSFKFAIDEIYWIDGAPAIQQAPSILYTVLGDAADFKLDVDGGFDIWENTLNASFGINGLTVTDNGKGWSGTAFRPFTPYNMSAFATGNLIFDLTTTSTSTVSVGMACQNGGKLIDLNASYGYKNDGAVHTITIPLSTFNTDYYKLQNTTLLFELMAGTLTAPLTINNVRYEAAPVPCATAILDYPTAIAENAPITFNITASDASLIQVIISEKIADTDMSDIRSTTFYSAIPNPSYYPATGKHTVDIQYIFDNPKCNYSEPATFTVGATPLTSIQESGIFIYPNPVKNTLTVNGLDANTVCNIYNPLGVKIIESNSTSIDVTSLQAGVYILQANNFRTKFIKE